MNALEVIVIIVAVMAVLAAIASATGLLGRGARERADDTRMLHGQDVPVSERPSQEHEPPLPQRRVRGRPEAGTRR